MAHQFLQSRLANPIIEEGHREGVAKSMGRQSHYSCFQTNLTEKSAHLSSMLTRAAIVGKEKIIYPLPTAVLPRLKQFNTARSLRDNPIFQSLSFMDMQFPCAANLDHIGGFEHCQLCYTDTGVEKKGDNDFLQKSGTCLIDSWVSNAKCSSYRKTAGTDERIHKWMRYCSRLYRRGSGCPLIRLDR